MTYFATRRFEPLLRLRARLGGKEDSATLDAEPGSAKGSAGRGGVGGGCTTIWVYLGATESDRPKQLRLKALPVLIGPINLGMKRAGVRSAGNPHAAYDVAGVGNGVTERTEAPAYGESRRQTATPRPYYHCANFRPYLRGRGGSNLAWLPGARAGNFSGLPDPWISKMSER